jgi:hypothetical protein
MLVNRWRYKTCCTVTSLYLFRLKFTNDLFSLNTYMLIHHCVQLTCTLLPSGTPLFCWRPLLLHRWGQVSVVYLRVSLQLLLSKGLLSEGVNKIWPVFSTFLVRISIYVQYWPIIMSLKLCHSCFVSIIRNNKDTIRQYETLYYSKSKIITYFGCTRQPSSGLMFRKCKFLFCISEIATRFGCDSRNVYLL